MCHPLRGSGLSAMHKNWRLACRHSAAFDAALWEEVFQLVGELLHLFLGRV